MMMSLIVSFTECWLRHSPLYLRLLTESDETDIGCAGAILRATPS